MTHNTQTVYQYRRLCFRVHIMMILDTINIDIMALQMTC